MKPHANTPQTATAALHSIIPANRVANVGEYYFSKKLREVADLNAKGWEIISLGIGSPDLPPSSETIGTLCNEAKKKNTHGYQSYIGITELRESFASWYKEWYKVDLNSTKEILPLMGSKEGILHVSMAFLNAGDGVLVPNPGYPTYTSVSKLVGANIIPYDLKEENGWMPDFDAIEQMDLSEVKLMWVNYPHMPTGTNGSLHLFEQLIAFGRRHGIVICNDNPYSFILNEEPLSLLSVDGAKDICIEMNSLSKSHNMPGWRIGMLATNATFVEWILRVKSNIDSGMFRPMQLAAAKALMATPDWYKQMNEVYATRREAAEAILELLGCTWDPNQVGLFLWGRIPDNLSGSAELADALLYEARVFITPGFVFGSNGNRYIRLSLCADEQTLWRAYFRIVASISKAA